MTTAIDRNESILNRIEDEAWETVSRDARLNMMTLEKHADKINWLKFSQNRRVRWTVNALRKFADRIDWNEFSESCPDELVCESVLRQFLNRWNWKRLSQHHAFYNNWDLLAKYADKADWSCIIRNWHIHDPLEFFERFHAHIPMDELPGSPLWRDMVKAKAWELTQEKTGDKDVDGGCEWCISEREL